MGAAETEVATRFLRAVGEAVRTGDREPVYPLVARDVEWVTPKRTLHGIDEIKEQLTWGFPPENLDVEFELGEPTELSEDRVSFYLCNVYRWTQTGDFAHERRRRVELTIRDGLITRYEMRVVG